MIIMMWIIYNMYEWSFNFNLWDYLNVENMSKMIYENLNTGLKWTSILSFIFSILFHFLLGIFWSTYM